MKLIKHFFRRNRERQTQGKNSFLKASGHIKLIADILISGICVPMVLVTTLFSPSFLLVIANLLLFCGNIFNLSSRIISGNLSAFEAVIMCIGMSTLLALTFAFLPVIPALWGVWGVLNFLSFIAVAINTYFIIDDFFLPFCKGIVTYVSRWLGVTIDSDYVSHKNLSLEQDAFVIEKLFKVHYPDETIDDSNFEQKLKPFNQLLQVLSDYLDKYQSSLWGFLSNQEKISCVDTHLTALTVRGHTPDALDFIETKLKFKHIKVKRLEEAREEISSISSFEDASEKNCYKLRFFESHSVNESNWQSVQQAGVSMLSDEIARQQTKIERLESCLPSLSSAMGS